MVSICHLSVENTPKNFRPTGVGRGKIKGFVGIQGRGLRNLAVNLAVVYEIWLKDR